MSGRAAGVDDALGNALVVKVIDLLAKDEVFQQHRASRAGAQGVLVVADRHALLGGEDRTTGDGLLVQLATCGMLALDYVSGGLLRSRPLRLDGSGGAGSAARSGTKQVATCHVRHCGLLDSPERKAT